ncbi:alpha/beta fold hydrolase [Roseibacillus ishigakijimensis]|uniref:Alpha/beta fold hydrolase n=1 Tax=Roseibacillus ishigakijimensis TaxID=454146 RepID=A0A934RL89_9BACT|nr:alpha/beta fold hydrolase [Roseibacillus ishigakijimensis]MBK1832913.1 alpha/beta fold hydrolase [Roseibacillus ishigakijimensis]
MIWCLHGAIGRAGDWDDFSGALAAHGETCRAVDLWRFQECDSLSFADWAGAFNAEVAAAGAAENVLVGYSLGGRLALHALLARPSLWQKAVIVSAHPGLRAEPERFQRMVVDAEWAASVLTADWGQFLRNWDEQGVLQSDVVRPDPDPRLKLVNRRRAIARSFMEWSLGKQEDLRPRLAEISCPILWLTGERDGKFTRLAGEAAPLLSCGRHQAVADCGHRLPWERPEEFLRLVREFVCKKKSDPKAG